MNRELWDIYAKSDRGKRVIGLFSFAESADIVKNVESLIEVSHDWGGDMQKEKAIQWLSIIEENMEANGLLDGELTRNSWSDFVDQYEIVIPDYDEDGGVVFSNENQAKLIRQEGYRNKSAVIPFLSLFLFYKNGGVFKPMLLPTRHDVFLKNCDAIGVDIPPIPSTSTNHRDFSIYYFDICTSINKFQENNGMTDAEACACIYDFATMLTDGKKQMEKLELPSPTNVWLTGASGIDFEFLDAVGNCAEQDAKPQLWACNERTRRGDIIVMYCLSPRSYIHSVWRADNSGVFSPFDYYHCRTAVCDGIKTPHVTLKDLKADHYFSQLPIVRKNLQGIKGWELSAQDYSELLRIIREKGGDDYVIPRLFDGGCYDFGEIKVEKDVEEKILIPALSRLGYEDGDWVRQLPLKSGRNGRSIPDFVFFPYGKRHFENAPLVIEAKFDMSSMVEFRNAFGQALSYARMLRSSLMAICDKERIIVYEVSDGNADIHTPVFENHWTSIFASDAIGGALKHVIGRETIINMRRK